MAGQVHVSAHLGSQLLRRMTAGAATASARPALSGREVEVLRLVAAGRGTREIADALNRSVKTIETHKQSLKAKLGADSPTQLVRLALAWCAEHT
jgi:DNA-binding NarL/FixJ family response regulator